MARNEVIASPEEEVQDGASLSRDDHSLRAWRMRAKDAEDLHDDWEMTFKCRELHSKYVGTHQWLEDEDPDGDKYYVNLFFSGIENQRPALHFSVPKFELKPRPTRVDDPFTPSEFRSKLFQDSINTVAQDRRVGFLYETMLALQDSFFRFGCVEVGLKGDIVDNPRANRPMMRDDIDAFVNDKGEGIMEPSHLSVEEQPYVKWIPANQVIVSTSNKNSTDSNDWIGYWSWVRKEDILANPFYDQDVAKDISTGFVDDNESGYAQNKNYPEKNRYVKLYRIFDLRARKKRVFAESGDGFLLTEGYRVLPLSFLKRHEILNSWYPVPPTYNWIPQQRELNDSRETQRIHRRRFLRKYTVIEGSINPKELDKLESNEDGVYAFVPRHDDIKPMADAELGRTLHLQIPQTKEDFMLVSGVTGERQGVQEAETATQANIIDTNARIRDMYSKQLVGRWMAEIAYKLLLVMAEQASAPFWVDLNIDKTSVGAPQEAMEIMQAWQLIQTTQLDMDQILNFEMDLDIDTLSPSDDQRNRSDWMQVIGMVIDPMVSLHLLASDTLLRKTLKLHGVTKEREIQEVKAAMGKVQVYLIQREMMAAQGILAPPPFDTSSSGRPSPLGLPSGGGPGGGNTGGGSSPTGQQLPTPGGGGPARPAAQPAINTQLAGQVPQGGRR